MIKMIIITGIFLVSAQVSAIEHKPNHKPTPKVTVVSFDKKVAKKKTANKSSNKASKKLSMKALDKKLKRQAKFKSMPCKDGYISNNKAYCAVKAQPKALAKLDLKLDKKAKPERAVASQKDLESKRKK